MSILPPPEYLIVKIVKKILVTDLNHFVNVFEHMVKMFKDIMKMCGGIVKMF